MFIYLYSSILHYVFWSSVIKCIGICNCCSIAKLCLTLCNPMNCSLPGFPVFPYLLEFAQIHVHSISDAIQPSLYPLDDFIHISLIRCTSWSMVIFFALKSTLSDINLATPNFSWLVLPDYIYFFSPFLYIVCVFILKMFFLWAVSSCFFQFDNPCLLVMGFPDSSVGKESTCNAWDPGSIPGLGRYAAEGIGYPLQYSWASLVAQLVRNLPEMWETWVHWGI